MKKTLFLVFCLAVFISCDKDNIGLEKENVDINFENKTQKSLDDFGKILSKITYESKEVRGFLKKEALKKFDKNYNILYYLVKDDKIGDKSFRELLIEFSSEEEIRQIETNVPLLNILIPEISFFEVSAENLNIEDKEIPVAISNKRGVDLYLNGKVEATIVNGEVPDFHVFVVRENDRVDPKSIRYNNRREMMSFSDTERNNKISFLSSEYDNINNEVKLTSRTWVTENGMHPIVSESYYHFNSDSNGANGKAYQRDFIYYGIVNKDSKGTLNQNVKDYIDYIVINPRAYFSFNLNADDKGNPTIGNSEITQKGRELSEEEQITRMWTKGAYEFRFNIVSANNTLPYTVKIPLMPSEIWNFNIEHSRKHGTMFSSSKNTYKIDPAKFTSKLVYLNSKVAFEKWDIENTSTVQYVSIFEENRGVDITTDDTFTFETAAEGKFNIGVKFGLGDIASLDLGGDVKFNNKKVVVKNIKKTYKINDEVLANNVKVYFYDPVITARRGPIMSDRRTRYNIFEYDTGIIRFSVVPKFQ